MLRILKHLGLDLHKKDDLGMTPLHRATLTNAYSAAKFLLLNGADPYVQDLKHRDVFAVASENKAAAVRQLLVDYGNEHNPIYGFFTYLFLAFWAGTYYCYYSWVIEFTSFKLGLSLCFNFCVMWLLPLFL
jgi:ankyrin repeat protein